MRGSKWRLERARALQKREAERRARRAAIHAVESKMPPATVACLRHAGTHLIRPIVFDLGFRIVEPGYQAVNYETGEEFIAPIDKAEGPVILFPRDPRNRIVALCRWKLEHSAATRSIVTRNGTATTKDAMVVATMESEPFLANMLEWAQIWCVDRAADSLRVTFEDLSKSEHSARALVGKMADHLGLSPDGARDRRIVAAHFRQSPTYTGDLSRYKDWFGPESWHTWESQGGPQLMHLMGYEP